VGDARHGRRDNGLVAAEYAAAGDVDPRVGEHLLDVLALDGIAAFLRPSTDMHPVTRSSSLPGRPTDRLYVDRVHLATARDYLARLAGENDPPDATPQASARDATDAADSVDDAWAKIVAGFDAEVDTPRRPWPDTEEISDSGPLRWGIGPGRQPARTEPTTPEIGASPESSLLDGLDTFGADLPDDEDGYTPPAAPPVPRPSLPTALAVAGIVFGLILFLSPDLLPTSENVAMLTGFTAIIAGFATLVWRLRPGDEDDEDSDPDQGARV